jgi:cell division protease FtsH
MIVGLLGGRAAEELKFETVTTGASNDIERATAIARNMVTQYGMSKRFGLMGLATVESRYLEGRAVLNCSDVTAAAVDEEVRQIMEDCYNEAKAILSENMDAMDMIAEHLIREETITGKDFMRLYRQAKGIPEPEKDSTEAKIEAERKAIAEIESTPAPEPAPVASAPEEATAPAAPVSEETTAPEQTTAPAAPKESPAPEKAVAPEAKKSPAADAQDSDDEESGEDGSEDDESGEQPEKKGPRGQFSDVPKEDVDRLFKK